jgi:hypothetical protein
MMDECHEKDVMQLRGKKRDQPDAQHLIIDLSAPTLKPSSRIHLP